MRWFPLSWILVAACAGDAPPGSDSDSPDPGAEAAAGPEAAAPSVVIAPERLAPFEPLPTTFAGPDGPAPPELAARGEDWFRDPDLSVGGARSCASCHDPAPGAERPPTPRDVPTLENVAAHTLFGWDGRAETLEDYLALHLLDAWATGFTGEQEVADAAGAPFDRVVAALSAYLRTLNRPGRWDRFLAGEEAALTDPERRGFLAFQAVGCTMCHTGSSFGGNDRQLLGMFDSWPGLEDPGYAAISGDDSDEGVFRTAPLRGVAATAPYGHAGTVPTLEEMVRRMAEIQLGAELDAQQVSDIVAWLGTL
ncbi:MAG: hypothetical protein D6702_10225 [Planctomycetota bacterium]|nr:MAG: hypothetical protein D6702_10225 [Planctomycetota bacterium]